MENIILVILRKLDSYRHLYTSCIIRQLSRLQKFPLTPFEFWFPIFHPFFFYTPLLCTLSQAIESLDMEHIYALKLPPSCIPPQISTGGRVLYFVYHASINVQRPISKGCWSRVCTRDALTEMLGRWSRGPLSVVVKDVSYTHTYCVYFLTYQKWQCYWDFFFFVAFLFIEIKILV